MYARLQASHVIFPLVHFGNRERSDPFVASEMSMNQLSLPEVQFFREILRI